MKKQNIDGFTVRNGFPEKVGVKPGYSDFFDGLMQVVRSGGMSEPIGEQINAYVMEWLKTHPLDCFDRYSDEKYVRDYIGHCPETAWEALVMTWKEGNATTVHGHPQFAGYHFSDGIFRVEIFEKSGADGDLPRVARRVDTVVIDHPTAFYAIGDPCCFDNHIHRITCLSSTGHSLHVYSDDALRGEVFAEEA